MGEIRGVDPGGFDPLKICRRG